MTKTPVRLSDLFRYYKHGTPHQMAAIAELEAALLKVAPDALNRDQPWFKTWSQAGKQQDLAPNTWSGVSKSAQKAGAKFPELVAAQWALESGWGKHLSGKHNYFGLKGSGTSKSTQEFINGQWITITDSFIDFPNLQSCVQYLVDRWHKDYKSYKGVNRAANRDAAAQMLVSQGYATDPSYAQKLKKLMSENAPVANDVAPVNNKPPAQQLPYKVKPSDPFGTRLSPNITLGEFALGQPARRFIAQHQVDTAAELAAFLERVRVAFGGKRVTITSGYRPPAINKMVHGAISSEHLFNAPNVGAVDFYIDGVDIYQVQGWCDKQWPYSVGYGAAKGFVHLGIRQGRPRVRWDY